MPDICCIVERVVYRPGIHYVGLLLLLELTNWMVKKHKTIVML